MPKPNYKPTLKRSNSMATDLAANSNCKLQIKESKGLSHQVSSEMPLNRIDELKKGGNLHAIAEETVENDTIDFALAGKRKESKPPVSRLQHKRNLRGPVQSVQSGS